MLSGTLRINVEADQSNSLTEALYEARSLGFIGPGPIEAHLQQASRFVDVTRHLNASKVLDLGSGAGIPGLVLANELSHLRVTLVDVSERRTCFLRRLVEDQRLGERVGVVRARAEELARAPGLRGQFDVVTARSFGPPAVVAECAAGFLHVGGTLIVAEPEETPLRWKRNQLHLLGMELAEQSFPYLALVRQVTLCDTRYPRRNGLPAKRPLF